MVHAPPPLPALAQVTAAPSWQAIDFISDLHLAGNTPLTFEAFARHLLDTPADAVFILGDLFDAWIGDDSRHQGFEARCAQVMADAATRRGIAFMVGNRDFLVGPDFLDGCGLTALPDPCVLHAFGQRVLLTHGDAWCLSDTPYQAFRTEVRSSTWQQRFLSLPLAQRRELASRMRAESQRLQSGPMAGENSGDVDLPTATAWMRAAQAPVLIHGHTHRPGSEPLSPEAAFTRHVLSDWDLDGHHGPARGEVLRLTQRGVARLSLGSALLPMPAAADATPHAAAPVA